MTTTVTTPGTVPDMYGLVRPTVDDVHAALRTVLGDRGDEVWRTALTTAEAGGGRDEPAVTRRLIDTLCASTNPVAALCGRAQRIRMTGYERLTAAQQIIAAVSD